MTRAAVARFAGGALPPLAFVVASLLLAWTAGGQAALGRIDPALAIPIMMPAALLYAWLARRAGTAGAAAMLAATAIALTAAQLGLVRLLAGRHAPEQSIDALVAAMLALVLASRVMAWRPVRRGWRKLALAVGLCALWFAGAHSWLAWRYAPATGGGKAVMLTSLPLRWVGGGDLGAMLARGPADGPALAALDDALALRLADSMEGVGPAEALVLAHPAALPPADLVAIDAHVRGGGRAMILADALSGWPPAYPLGDRRNPPVTSLLTPLLDHWGVALAAPDDDRASLVDVMVGTHRLRLASAGRFTALPPVCRAYGDRHVAHCRIGKGSAWLVGDADLLQPSLWQPPSARAPHLRRADNIAWIIAAVGSDEGVGGALAPIWIAGGRD